MDANPEATEDAFTIISRKPKPPKDIPPVFHLPKLNGHELFEVSVDELQHLLSSQAFTSEEYTQFCLDRIQAVNPYLEAVIEVNPDALAIAKGLDEERKDGNVRGPLHGVPVLVKDVSPFFALQIEDGVEGRRDYYMPGPRSPLPAYEEQSTHV